MNTSPPTPTTLDPDAVLPGRLRSGTVARLAGLPVTTLRVWERRYGVVAAPKTTTGHRQYSQHDVARLRLLKQLTDHGHAIGTVASLPIEELQAIQTMQALSPGVPPVHSSASPWRVVAVGRSMAHKLSGIVACELLVVHDDLDRAEADAAVLPAAPASSSVPRVCDVLLVHLTSLQPAAAQRVMALGTALHATQVIVVYAFGSDAVAEDLRVGGATVRREPVTGRDLGRLISTGHHTAHAASADLAKPPPRRFSDEELSAIAELPSAVACECPRHVAELVAQLAGFEQYSGDCSSRTPADAALHRHLSHLAGAARARFEQALTRIMAAEGLVLRGQYKAELLAAAAK